MPTHDPGIDRAPPSPTLVRPVPRGWRMLLLVGPSLIWCAEYIGSGEVILSTRLGAILGVGVLWAIVLGIFLKYWIGMSGGIYTVCTGEGMIDMFARLPGPRHAMVWIVLVVQLCAATVSMGAIASAAGAFIAPIAGCSPFEAGLAATGVAIFVAWSGEFRVLKIAMSLLVAITVLGVLYVAAHVLPPLPRLLSALLPTVPPVPDWAVAAGHATRSWDEILPLIGWGAGGFASQVWYSYWVLGAGYGAAAAAQYGQPADEARLRALSRDDGLQLKKWCRVIHLDATVALLIGTITTSAFLIAGAGVLGPQRLAPEGQECANTLSLLFSQRWGALGGTLFMMGGAAAMVSTLIGQFAGWPRLIADALRICVPAWRTALVWKTQFRLLLAFFLVTNTLFVFYLGYEPIRMIKISALLDGLLLTSLQAIGVGLGLYVVLPKLLTAEVYQLVRPSGWIAFGLLLAAVAFAWLCLIVVM